MKELILAVWLGIQAIYDFKYKEIPLGICVGGSLIGIAFGVVEHRRIDTIMVALIPGILLLVFSWLSKEVIGYGDGLVLLTMAFFLSIQQQVYILMMAFGIAGIVALILLLVFRKKRKYRIPFVPFIFAAFLIEYVSHMEKVGI